MDWNKREMDWYYRAIINSDYPDIIINFITDFLHKEEKVLDIGSGIGTYTLPLAQNVKKVIAIDYSKEMLNYLKNKAREKGLISKIEVIQGDWNKIDFSNKGKINSLVTAYSGREIFGNKKSILKMKNVVNDYVFLFVPGERKRHSFSTDILFEKLGRKKRRHRCNYRDVEKILSDLKIDFNKKVFNYEFGQPFLSYKEAVEFFRFHYSLEKTETKTLKYFLDDHLIEKNEYLWMKNNKQSVLYFWRN